MNIALSLMYEGTAYNGWQRQLNANAVQNVLEKVLSSVFSQPVETTGSGRTDTGVHAEEQIAVFQLDKSPIPLEKLPMVLNGKLPQDIRILKAWQAADNFHPRYHGRVRHYRYTLIDQSRERPGGELIHQRFAHCPGVRLDLHRIRNYLRPLQGSHDFSSYSSVNDPSPVKTREIFRIEVSREGQLVHIDLYGNGFLRSMVRAIIGCLLSVYKNGEDEGIMGEILAKKDPMAVKLRAPAKGLTLKKIYYNMIFGDREYYPDWTK